MVVHWMTYFPRQFSFVILLVTYIVTHGCNGIYRLECVFIVLSNDDLSCMAC